MIGEQIQLHNTGRAYLVGTRLGRVTAQEAREHMQELEELVTTQGLEIAGSEIIALDRKNAALLIGTGKADWIEAELRRLDAGCLIFDDEITPSQQRNWEKRLKDVCVIDRQEVILDIFARRARTPEATLQIQLARLEYSLPRLRRAWLHLERQRNASGARGGSGEMQIETDRRLVREQILTLKKKLRDVQQRRETQRKRRDSRNMPVAAIVGYTNAGKSSLFNALTQADVLCEDKLFATLDPTTRPLILPNNREILLSDTVGFIRKLPHNLVQAFKATLEESALADVLVHVADASHPNCREHISTTQEVLKELKADDRPMILALNKIDLIEDPEQALEFYHGDYKVIPLSAKTGAGLDRLRDALVELSPERTETLELEIPSSRYDLVALLHREGRVLERKDEAECVRLCVTLPLHMLQQFTNYRLR